MDPICLLCGREHYSAERGHSHQGILFSRKGVQVSNSHTADHPRDMKENGIHQTRPPSSIPPWSSSAAHVPIVGAFGSRQGTDCSVAMQHHTQEVAMLCVSWHLSIRTGLKAFSNLIAHLLDLTIRASLHSPRASLSHGCPWLCRLFTAVFQCYFLGTLLIDTDHCIPGKPHKSCSFGEALTQSSSHHNNQTRPNPYLGTFFLLLAHQLNKCFSLCLSVVIMLCLISVFIVWAQCMIYTTYRNLENSTTKAKARIRKQSS